MLQKDAMPVNQTQTTAECFSEMIEYALAFGALGIIVLFLAWREHAADNKRDAKLMATCGATGLVTSVAAVLLT